MTETNEGEWPPRLDAVIAAPKNHRVLMEDETVRVLEVTVEPGEREALHHHRCQASWSSSRGRTT
jgi:hypothetical protein